MSASSSRRAVLVLAAGGLLGTLAPRVARGKPARAPAIVGAWRLTGVTTAKGPMPKEQLEGVVTVWSFAKDGTLKMMSTGDGKTQTGKATWSVKGDQLSIVENGQTQVLRFAIQGDTLSTVKPETKVSVTFARVKL